MKLNIPTITRPIKLADYAIELAPGVVQVWVNPPKSVLEMYRTLQQQNEGLQNKLPAAPADETKPLLDEMSRVGVGFSEWYAQIWSQGPEIELHWTADEVRAVVGLTTDPALYQWLTRRTWELINEHRSANQIR